MGQPRRTSHRFFLTWALLLCAGFAVTHGVMRVQFVVDVRLYVVRLRERELQRIAEHSAGLCGVFDLDGHPRVRCRNSIIGLNIIHSFLLNSPTHLPRRASLPLPRSDGFPDSAKRASALTAKKETSSSTGQRPPAQRSHPVTAVVHQEKSSREALGNRRHSMF